MCVGGNRCGGAQCGDDDDDGRTGVRERDTSMGVRRAQYGCVLCVCGVCCVCVMVCCVLLEGCVCVVCMSCDVDRGSGARGVWATDRVTDRPMYDVVAG